MIINQYQIKTKGEDKMKEKQGYKIVDIKWDTDGDKALFDSLPQEIILPEQFCTEDKDDYDYLDEVSEWLSDEYGYCQSGFRIQKTVSLKEWLMMQFNYCNAIASDISEHNKSKEIQEYTKQFAEIESPLVGGTDEKWIRINWGDIYIYLYDDGSIRYLRGEDVVGSVFLVAVPTEGIFGGYSYLSLTITDHVFIVTQLPEKSVAAFALLENSGEKLADSVETYEPEHEEDVSMETDTKEKLEEESEKETSVEPETVVKEAEPVKELLKKEMEEALRKEDPVKKTEGEKQTIAENETTEEAEIMLDASKDEKTSDISDDEFDLDREISELEEELPML